MQIPPLALCRKNPDIGIAYRLGIIKQVRNVGTSVIWNISLIQYGSNQPIDKGVHITEVALYCRL